MLEQNYEYDLLEPDKLLRKYVGREVTLVRLRQVDGATREEEVRARLLSYNNAPVWQIGSEIVTGMHADHIRFPELPGNLHARPTLIWSLSNDGAVRHRVEASYLAGLCRSVTLIHRRDELRASKVMQRRVLANPKIRVLWSHVVVDVLDVAQDRVTGVRVRNLKTGEETTVPCTGFFLAIGHVPNTRIFEGALALDGNGYIVCKPDSSTTSVEGVFACGDCVDHVYRQAITAAGMGCRAAIDAERWLEGQGR